MSDLDVLGTESSRLDNALSSEIDPEARRRIWASTQHILSHGPLSATGGADSTGLALGYVQSGKTTSIIALTAAAADAGYNVVVALLGTTNLLLGQNRSRVEASLGIGVRSDYKWISEPNPSSDAAGNRIRDYVGRGRVCFIPLLKHAGRVRSASEQLAKLPPDCKVLIIDDEADQASLNTGTETESKTYEAIKLLRQHVPSHMYVQFTATPYAPLLLDAADMLSPQFVEFLTPGEGYTGGKEFLIDNAFRVVRDVPVLDEQASKSPPLQLQSSLNEALASFLAGAALLLCAEPTTPPISMLVHSTARNDVQERYEFLLQRQVRKWREQVAGTDSNSMPEEIRLERKRLVEYGALDVDESQFQAQLRFVLAEVTTWLVNSRADVDKIDWTVAPIHVLIGGNKLDRGFTVEGLTVTYMNRPASPQVDTLEQRARAFGYRGDLLPYCQFFASKRTVRSLIEIVHTEEDLRARLREHVESGGSVRTWAREIGMLMPEGMRPTRDSVVHALSSMALGWHSMRRPLLDPLANQTNRNMLQEVGLLDAAFRNYGRLEFRTLEVDDKSILTRLLNDWQRDSFSPGWLHDEFVEAIDRNFDRVRRATILLMEDAGQPRVRKWSEELGFVNLFQGRDLKPQPDGAFYPGDRQILDLDTNPDQIVVQVHRIYIRDARDPQEILALAIYLGAGRIFRKDQE